MNKEQFPSANSDIKKNKDQAEPSRAERELSEKIERLPVDDSEKMDTLLLWRGLKKATELEIQDITDDGIKNAQDTFSALNLQWVFNGTVRFEEDGVERGSFYVAKDEKDIEIIRAWQSVGGMESVRAAGLAFGFPPTAVEAFCKRLEEGIVPDGSEKYTIQPEDLPDDIRDQEFMAFAQFRLSREHWLEELETAKSWASTIKVFNPALYDRILASHKEILALDEVRKFTTRETFAIEDRLSDGEDGTASLGDVLGRVAEWVGGEDFKQTVMPATYEYILANVSYVKGQFDKAQGEFDDGKIPVDMQKELARQLRMSM